MFNFPINQILWSRINFLGHFFQSVVYKVMNNPTDSSDRPIQPVKIADSKVFQVDQPFVVAKEGATM